MFKLILEICLFTQFTERKILLPANVSGLRSFPCKDIVYNIIRNTF